MSPDRSIALVIAALLMMVALAGCSPRGDEDAFFRQVRAWAPVGTPADEAALAMRSRRFEVFEHADDDEDGRTYLDCTRARIDVRNNIETQWRARLFLDDDRRVETIEAHVQDVRIED